MKSVPKKSARGVDPKQRSKEPWEVKGRKGLGYFFGGVGKLRLEIVDLLQKIATLFRGQIHRVSAAEADKGIILNRILEKLKARLATTRARNLDANKVNRPRHSLYYSASALIG
jgi:hypothetical protein